MFEVLLESRHVGMRLPRMGAAFSAIAHAGVAAVFLAGQQKAGTGMPDLTEQLRFMLPPDRVAPPVPEAIEYIRLEAGDPDHGSNDGRLKFHVAGDFGASLRTETPKTEPELSLEEIASAALAEAQKSLPENTYTLVDVDTAVFRYPESAAPTYPESLRRRGITGQAVVQFIVDSTGVIDLSTVKFLQATHPEFAMAVRNAMPRMKFHPAKIGPRAVGQLAQQLFRFEIRSPGDSSSANALAAKEP